MLGIKILIDKILGAIFPGLRLQRKIDDTAERSIDNLAVKENEQFKLNKNLAIANRSRVSCINTNNNTMTLKSGLEVTQGN